MRNLLSYLALALLLPLALRAQTPAADSLKGRVWTATARRIWVDTRPRAPQPPAWPTNAAFTAWLGTQGKGEKSGIGLLRGDVVRTLGAGRLATPAQVAQAILAEAASPPPSRPWLRQLNVPALQAALRQLVPLGAAAATAAGPGATVLATNDSLLAPPLPAAATPETASVGFFGRNPELAALLGALLGALLAYGLLRSLRRRSRYRSHGTSHTPATPHATPQDSAEVLRLQNEVQRLAHYIKQLEAKLLHYENASAADTALAPATDPEPALAPPVPPAELPHDAAAPAPAPGAAPHP